MNKFQDGTAGYPKGKKFKRFVLYFFGMDSGEVVFQACGDGSEVRGTDLIRRYCFNMKGMKVFIKRAATT